MGNRDEKPVVKEKPKGEREGKKPHKNKPTSQKYKHYKDGKKDKTCPRCGSGTFLAVHDNRLHCGKCKYTEFTKR